MLLTEIQTITKNNRNFDVDYYIEEKAKAINKFFRDNGLDSCVLGISGGIDSAVTLGLLHEASKRSDSPIKQIMPISIPIKDVDGISDQHDSAYYAELVFEDFGYTYYEVNLRSAYKSIIYNSCDVHEKQSWAYGQMGSVLRTPVLYYHAAILQTAGYKSIVIGTTNRDEGAYIGFFGKASDAMVDLQPIGDIHKSEVYAVAKKLKISQDIIDRRPQGDVWDSKVDEEMIGAPYWFLEMYQLAMEQHNTHLFLKLELDEKLQAYRWIEAIEAIHKTNAHKYKVGSPAHFIDVYKREIKK
jgi:NAD+ synthase (glutamine-hydrolysing)